MRGGVNGGGGRGRVQDADVADGIGNGPTASRKVHFQNRAGFPRDNEVNRPRRRWYRCHFSRNQCTSSSPLQLFTGRFIHWAVVFAVLTIIAAVVGFRGIVGISNGVARLFVFLFLMLFVASLILWVSASRFAPSRLPVADQ